MDTADSNIIEEDAKESAQQQILRTLLGGQCHGCQATFTAREAVLSMALGMQYMPRCICCISQKLQREERTLWSNLVDHLRGLDCYLKAWHDAERFDGVPLTNFEAVEPHTIVTSADPPDTLVAHDHWDAGDMGCGELVMALRQRVQILPPGGILRLTATDPAAPEDIPSWCRLTGNALVTYHHPHYWIRRQGD